MLGNERKLFSCQGSNIQTIGFNGFSYQLPLVSTLILTLVASELNPLPRVVPILVKLPETGSSLRLPFPVSCHNYNSHIPSCYKVLKVAGFRSS